MSETEGTVRHPRGGVPVRALRVEVVEGAPASATSRERITVGSAQGNDLELADPAVSRFHLEIVRAHDRFRVIDRGSTNGTAIGPVTFRGAQVEVAPETLITIGSTQLRLRDGDISIVAPTSGQLGAMRGRAPAMHALFTDIERAARSDASVLVLGESGTGKELVARALHELGPRSSGPCVTVDCGAMPPQLLASELFGHERGAFTSADRRHVGAFERASGGTLFLDELGELDVASQVALLGALERRTIRRVGGERDIAVDVRVVAATNADLVSRVNDGRFRLDLYYRLAVVVLHVPPLRERGDDVLMLAEHFLRNAGHDGTLESLVDRATLRWLVTHRWPGNVRELRNVVESLLATGRVPSATPGAAQTPAPSEGRGTHTLMAALDLSYRESRAGLLAEFERVYLERLLAACDGNVRRAAREARMDRSYLIDLLKRHGVALER